MINRIANRLNIQESCIIDNPIFKKLFYENTNISKKDRDIFINQIQKITLLFSFSQDTINIRPYKDDEREYDEIAVILIEVSADAKVKRMEEIIQLSIPYPIVLIFVNNNDIKINVAHKRINKVDESKNTVEKPLSPEWINLNSTSLIETAFINSLNTKELNFSNCYKLYTDIYNRVMIFRLSRYTNEYDVLLEKDPKYIEECFNRINNLENTIEELRREIKKEQQLNLQINLNIKIKGLEKEKNMIIDELKA